MISRPYQFLFFIMLGFFNPITLFWFHGLTWVFVVPCTLMIWFITKWQEIVKIKETSKLLEVLFALGIYASNLARNALTRPGFGLFDMFATFISVCIAFYGLKGLKHFILPTAYLSILIVGYQLEFIIPEVTFLQNFLANAITSILNFLTINASANNNVVTLHTIEEVFSLTIDKDCTGLKGILAYGSLAVLMILDVKTTYKRKALCTVVGFVGTFFLNILRLLTIFLACYFFGIEAALAVHAYLGYSLFIVWVLVFWTIAFKYMLRPLEQAGTQERK